MYKKVLVTLLILVLSIAIIGCSKEKSQDTASQDLQSLTIGVMPDVDSIPFIIAKHNGYFENEGLDVKIEHFKSAMDRDTALQTGNIDGAISDMLAVVFLNDNEFNVKITSKTNGSFKLIAAKDSNISTLENPKDRSIGISKNTIIEYLTDRIMENSNIDVDSPKKMAIPKIPTRLEMLENGKIDMATLPEPLASVAASKGGKVLSSSDKLGINPGIMLFTEETIKTKPDELKALYRAYNKSVEYLEKESLESYIDVLIEEAGFPGVIKETLTLPDYVEASMPSEEEFTQVLDWLKSKDLTSSDYTLDELSDKNFIKP
ncbi:MetQ/NlpA family ABC transporter substrate-binding protein [Wukongibacter baidiensis]|uniref:ABC transporter substrate-binding protein n=1 Tax=Wukongibacter baidiensis TaxID=1723361 RepID=UPI003D7FEF4B